jgi:hypothetical protein
MSMQSEGKDAKGRNYDQATKGGSSSAGSMGAGGTGDIGRMSGRVEGGNAQAESRTDDLMTSDTEQEQRQGFRPSEPGAVETGLEGIGTRIGGNPGNRQSGKDGQKYAIAKEVSMSTQEGPKEPKGGADIGGARNQHNDWGHSDVGAGNKQSESRLDDVVGSDTGAPGEEAGELQTGLGGIESLSTGNAGSRQSEGDEQTRGERGGQRNRQ